MAVQDGCSRWGCFQGGLNVVVKSVLDIVVKLEGYQDK